MLYCEIESLYSATVGLALVAVAVAACLFWAVAVSGSVKGFVRRYVASPMRFAVLALSVGIVTYVAGTKPSTNATDSAGTDGGGTNVTDFVENDYDTEGLRDSGDSPMTVSLFGDESENDESMLLGLEESQSENTISDGAVVYERWSRRGAYDDHFRVNFTNDWVFPASRTNRWTGATIFADGRLRGRLWNAEGEIAMTTNVISAIPGTSTFYHEYTPSNSYRFVWKNFGLNRRAERLVTGSVELFRNGDYAVEYEGEREYYPRANPWPELPVGQSAAEQAATVSAVGTNLENGLYYISANFASDPEEFVRLVCGTNSLVVTNAGEYVFLCEKGAEYEFWTEPFVTNVVWSAFDDVAADGGSPALMSAAGWEYAGCWTTDGGWHWFNVPWMTALGYSLWMPTLRGSPDVAHLGESDFPMTFRAMLVDFCRTNDVSYLWQSSDPNVVIESPNSIETEVDIDALPDWAHFDMAVTAHIGEHELCSLIAEAGYGSETVSIAIDVPDTMFANDDDDNDDGTPDRDDSQIDFNEDDVVYGRIEFHSDYLTSGTLRLSGLDDFAGDVYTNRSAGAMIAGECEWTISNTKDGAFPLWFNPYSRNLRHPGYTLMVTWTPENGESVTKTAQFTVVEPVAEPICNETKTVDGTIYTYNPSGIVIGGDAYFKIGLSPASYPDSRIIWSAVGAGSVEFVGGNTGREVHVRGVTAGDVRLFVSVGGCVSEKPRFLAKVVNNRQVGIAVRILADEVGVPVCSRRRVSEFLLAANNLYEQVGVHFVMTSIDEISISGGVADVWCGEGDRPGYASFDEVCASMSATDGLECYFARRLISAVDESEINGMNGLSGLIVSVSASDSTLAHELGHAFGLSDIYTTVDTSSITGENADCYAMPDDWPGGGGSLSRYYDLNTGLSTLIERMVMYGEGKADRRDISYGPVRGVLYGSDTYVNGLAPVGFFDNALKTETPVHQ